MTPMEQAAHERAEYCAGLRGLAELLETHPDIPLPYTGDLSPLSWILASGDDQRAILAAIARALPGKVDKRVRGDAFDLHGSIRGLRVGVIADRDEVCVRKVVGTEQVTRTIPDPSVEVPMVEVTETVDRIEWECTPLLAPPAALTPESTR